MSKTATVPVVPGKVEKNSDPKCGACRHLTTRTRREVHGGIEMLLCTDTVECSQRFRSGLAWPMYMSLVRTGYKP